MPDYQIVERLLDVRRFPEAERAIGERMAESPRAPEGPYYLARLAYEKDEFQNAKAHLAEASALDPHYLPAKTLAVLVHQMLGEDEERHAVIRDLLRAEPDDPDHLAAYARLLLDNLYLDEARALATEALARSPQARAAKVVMIYLELVDRDCASVQREMAALLQDDPDSEYLLSTLLDTLFQQRRYFDAERVARQLVRLRPDDPRYLDWLTTVRVKTHPLAWPLFPIHRVGWAFSACLALAGLSGLRYLSSSTGVYAIILLVMAWGAYIVLYILLLQRWVVTRAR